MSYSLDLYRGAEELDLEEVKEVVAEATEVAVEEVRADIAEIAVEVEETANNVEDLVDTVEDLEETAEEIEEAVEGMESMLSSGNYNAISFAHTFNRTARLSAKLGGRPVGSRLGAESLNDAATAELMAREGIESFMETVKRWGQKAIEFIKHIFNTIINFFHGIFDKAGAMHKRAEQLEKRLKDGSSIKAEVKAGGWTTWFDPERKDDGAIASLKEVTDFLGKVGEKPDDVNTKNVLKAANDLVSDIQKNFLLKIGSALTGSSKLKMYKIGGAARIGFDGAEEKASKAESSVGELAAFLRGIKMTSKVDDEAKKALKDKKYTPNAKQLQKCIDVAKAACSDLKGRKADKKFNSATRDKIIGHINATFAKSGEAGEAQRRETQDKVKMIQAAYATAASLDTAVTNIISKTVAARLDYVAASLAFGKDKEEEKK